MSHRPESPRHATRPLTATGHRRGRERVGDAHRCSHTSGRLVERYVAAWERNDVDALVSMLAQDARIAMPPRSTWYSGREQVAAFVRRYLLTERTRWRLVPTSANGQPAAAAYLWVEQAGAFMPEGLHVLTLRGGEIEEIMAFRSPEVFPASICPHRSPPDRSQYAPQIR
jgi:RNA polymerase sigma-70 factor (ECF subfamily)